jgi:acyl carrier protein
MTEDRILAALTEIFRDAFLRDDLVLRPEYTAADIEGWDSFKHIEIIIAVEERFAVKLTSRELDHLQSVGDLLALIRAKAPGGG